MHNVKPFQEIHVAPGLNKGFSYQGSGGFNSGTESREAWSDKTVDELRVATNPKQTFDLIGHQGPAQTLVKNVGIEGKVEKHLPDKFYINSPDRYLTTTGLQVASTARSIQPNPTIHRATTTQEYAGAPSSGVVQSQPKHGMYRSDHRQQFQSEGFTPATGHVEQNNLTVLSDSYKLLPTNREVIKSETFGGVYGLINALTAPITDMVRPTRKEDLVGLTRKGNAGSTVANAPITEMSVAPTVKQPCIVRIPWVNEPMLPLQMVDIKLPNNNPYKINAIPHPFLTWVSVEVSCLNPFPQKQIETLTFLQTE